MSFIPNMEEKAKPKMLAIIREAECIGCTKCIQACPVDAILGGAKQMHTVISDECTGCELCVSPCPVDCIDMITLNGVPAKQPEKASVARIRFQSRQKRLAHETAIKASIGESDSLLKKRNYIEEAIARAKTKKQIK
jgi:electron transport complex protein RnfB